MKLFVGIVLMVLWVGGVLLSPGCGPSEADATDAAVSRNLSFTIVNNSRTDIRSIGVEGTNLPLSFSPIEAGGTASLSNKKLELPQRLTLHWTDDRGERREASVRVWGELGTTYAGPITLTITDRNQVVLSGR